MTDALQSIFEDMYVIDINLAAYRNDINLPAPERDLATFIDQMQRVSLHVSIYRILNILWTHHCNIKYVFLQVQDVGSSSRMATLGNRARRLQSSVLQPLEVVRSEIIYHLTALELQKEPWSNQV